MSLLIKNAAVLTLDEKGTVFENTSLAIKGKKILSIGESPDGFEADEVIDGTDYLAMPAFFNSHTHSAMTLERGWAEDLPFDRWLNEKIWVAESAMEEDDVYWGSLLACCEFIRSGTVGFGDHYFWMNQVAKAVSEAGLKATLAWCQFGIGIEHEVGHVSLKDTFSFIRDWHKGAEGRIRCILGPHSPYMCPPEFLLKVVEGAKDCGVGIHLHVAESEEQVENSLKAHGKTPVAHLAHLGVFDNHSIAAHCIAVNDEDISILAEKGVYVAQTPKTYMKLAMGMAPLEKLFMGGVKLGLGTDGPGSNNDLNMLEGMRITGLVHKNRLSDPAAFPNDFILRMATRGSSEALGFNNSGAIKPGASADIILFNTKKSHWMPRHNLSANAVYSSHPGDIEYVICDGKILLSKGELTTLDEEKIQYEAEKRAFRMVGKSMNKVRTYKG